MHFIYSKLLIFSHLTSAIEIEIDLRTDKNLRLEEKEYSMSVVFYRFPLKNIYFKTWV